MKNFKFKHGGNIYYHAKKLNLSPSEIIDASASLVPFEPPHTLINALNLEIKKKSFKYYPESNQEDLKEIIGEFHKINPMNILPGNGASELITWAGYEASKLGISSIPSPAFVDYERSLNCWEAKYKYSKLPTTWNKSFPQSFPIIPLSDVIWINNPHNPTGQLWSKKSIEKIIKNYKLVICDEAFLSLTPNGEKESLISLTKKYNNILVIRSLTKLFNIAGLRLGYIVGSAETLKKLNKKRDPWPLNSFAIRAGIELMGNQNFYYDWTKKIHDWINIEKEWMFKELSKFKNIKVHYSSTNYFLIESKSSLTSNINYLAKKGILIRECSSFKFLNEKWARISLQDHQRNETILKEIQNSFKK